MHRTRLPVLRACDQDWAKMPRIGPHRHCGACDQEVLDLSAMTAESAIDALIARDGKACIRYRTDAAGEIQFAPPPPPRHPTLVAATALALTACAGWSDEPPVIPQGELGVCIADTDDAGACDRVDVPHSSERPSHASTPDPDPSDRAFAAQVDVAAPAGDGADDPSTGRPGGAAPTYDPQPIEDDDRSNIFGTLFFEAHNPETSLFDRESTAEPTIEWSATVELLRMKRELRREARQRRRDARRR